MRDARALVLAAICAALAPSAGAQQGPGSPAAADDSFPSSAPQLGGRRSLGPAVGLRPNTGRGAWKGGMFLDSPGGQGFNHVRGGAIDRGFRLRPEGLGPVPDAPRLGPPVDPAAATAAGAFVGYRYDNLLLSSGVRQGIAPGFGGAKLDVGASYGFNVAPRHLITLSGGLTMGQATALAPYFAALGPDAATRSSYRQGEPGAGFRVSWLYSFGRNLYLNTSLGYDRTYLEVEGQQGLDRSATSLGTVFGYRW